MTFGEKLKKARMEAGITQDELAEKLSVSRSAIAKWESDRGMPDISNLRYIAKILSVTVDYLLEDGEGMDLSVTRKTIDIDPSLSRLKKIECKEQIIREEYQDAEILRLTVTKIKNTKKETAADQIVGWFALLLGDIPLFGTQEFGKTLNILDQQYYLVNEKDRQYFVLLTDEHMVSRRMPSKITEKKFEIGDKKFLTVGIVK